MCSRPLADLRLGAPGELVGEHDVADPQPGLPGVRQQLLRRCGTGSGPGCCPRRAPGGRPRPRRGRSRRRPSSTHAGRSSAPVGVQRDEEHAVGVEVESLAAVQHDVVVDGELDRVLAARARACRAARMDSTRGSAAAGSTRSGSFALQPQDDRLDAAVPVPGRAERAEQLAADPGDAGRAGPRRAAGRAKEQAARIGPTVCELDGPIPTLNRSKALMVIRPPFARDVHLIYQSYSQCMSVTPKDKTSGPAAFTIDW